MTASLASPEPDVARRRRARASSAVSRTGLVVFSLLLVYMVVLPVVRLQGLALEDGGQGYRSAFGAAGIGRTIVNTVELAVGSLLIAMVLGTWLALVATRLPRRAQWLRALPILPIVLPPVASIVGWVFLLTPGPGYLNAVLRLLPWWSNDLVGPVDIYTVPWIIIITGLNLTSFMYIFVNAGLRNINGEVVEAAQVHGGSPRRVLLRVKLALLRPVLLYGGGVCLLLGLGQFTGPLLLGTNRGITVLTTRMFRASSQTVPDYGAAAALGTPLLLFGLAVVLVQKIGLGDRSRFVTSTGKSFRSGLKPSRWSVVAILTFTFFSTVLPIAALGIVALSPFWSSTIDPSAFTLDHFRQTLDQPEIIDSIVTGVTVSLVSVAIALPAGFVAATILMRKRGSIAWLVDLLVQLPLGVPAVIFGVGFLITYTSPPLVLYGTKWVIILVYITLMLPFTTRTQLSALVAMGDTHTEAARVSGAGPLRTQLRVVLPLLRPTLGGAAALMFVLLTHEFAASLLVRSATTQVMGTKLYDYFANGIYPVVACIALVMVFITTVGVAVATALGGSNVFNQL